MTQNHYSGFKPIRRDRLIQEQRHDTYKSARKLEEPTVCPSCSAVYRRGMWRWEPAVPDARRHTCPACHRLADDYPAGFVSLRGDFLQPHRSEIVNLVKNEGALERSERALARIMKIEDRDADVLITTTDIHLARRVGEAVHRAYAGELDYHYEDSENRLRVDWIRDA